MGEKGKSIACPLGVSNKKRRTETKPGGAAVTVAQLAISNSQYVNKHIPDIETAIQQAGQGQMELCSQITNEGNQELVIQDQDHINNILPQYDNAGVDPEVLPNINTPFSNYVQGSYYKKKKLKEHANWKKAYPEMFIAYMTLAQATFQWGNRSNWTPITTKTVAVGLWKYCTVQTQGFTLALDEFLDPANPLILTKSNQASESIISIEYSKSKFNPSDVLWLLLQPQRWQKTFSSAIDAYQHMLQKEKDLALCALFLTALDELAMNWPKCFGPLEPNEDPDECDY
ncbi:hypothetical protein DFH28DRAFT_935864 [Melampsora americana]|nr:hypothetical protein DFH28DRAFT_935864 [Melampsora americana]